MSSDVLATAPSLPEVVVCRARGAIVYLAQLGKHSSYAARWGWSAAEQASIAPQVDHLRRSISSLYRHYNARWRDPVVVFHNGDFGEREGAELKAALQVELKEALSISSSSLSKLNAAPSLSEISFVEISSQQDAERRKFGLNSLWDPPAALNTSEAAMAAWQGWKQYGLGYRQMIRWYALKLWVWAEEEGYDYIWRMDDDSFLHSPIDYHMFRFMCAHKLLYGFRQVVVDRSRDFEMALPSLIGRANATERLGRSMLGSFFTKPRGAAGLDLHAQRASAHELFAEHLIGGGAGGALSLDLKREGWSGLGWDNNFFISEVAFWKRPQVEAFLQGIDESGLIFTKRLNDLQIQAVATQLFLEAGQLVWFDDWSYSHATIFNKALSGGTIAYGGLSIGGSDPDPETTRNEYRDEHSGQLSSAMLAENPWPLWGDRGHNSHCRLPMVQGLKLNRFNGWLVRGRAAARMMQQLAAQICAKRELKLAGLYCPPPEAHHAVRATLAFRQHPKGLAYVNELLHAAYLPIPKAMSTTLRMIFTVINNATDMRARASEPWVSGGRNCPQGILSVPCANGVRILRSSTISSRYVFAIVREPLHRFLSAYQQIRRYRRDSDPWQYSVAASMGFSALVDADARFEAFVRETLQTGGEWDAHVLPQHRFLEGLVPKLAPKHASKRASKLVEVEGSTVHLFKMEDAQGIGEEISRGIKVATSASEQIEASLIETGLAVLRSELSDPKRAFNVWVGSGRGSSNGGYFEKGLAQMEALPNLLKRRWCALYALDYSMLGYELPRLCTPQSSLGSGDPQLVPMRAAVMNNGSVNPEAFADHDPTLEPHATATRPAEDHPDVWRTVYEARLHAWSAVDARGAALQPPRGVAAIMLSFNHVGNVEVLARDLRNASRVLQAVVIDDGSSDGASQVRRLRVA